MLLEFVQTVKQAAVEAVEARGPAIPVIGVVEEVAPISLGVGEMRLGSGQLIWLAGSMEMQIGAQIALLRFPGGGKYLVLGQILR